MNHHKRASWRTTASPTARTPAVSRVGNILWWQGFRHAEFQWPRDSMTNPNSFSGAVVGHGSRKRSKRTWPRASWKLPDPCAGDAEKALGLRLKQGTPGTCLFHIAAEEGQLAKHGHACVVVPLTQHGRCYYVCTGSWCTGHTQDVIIRKRALQGISCTTCTAPTIAHDQESRLLSTVAVDNKEQKDNSECGWTLQLWHRTRQSRIGYPSSGHRVGCRFSVLSGRIACVLVLASGRRHTRHTRHW